MSTLCHRLVHAVVFFAIAFLYSGNSHASYTGVVILDVEKVTVYQSRQCAETFFPALFCVEPATIQLEAFLGGQQFLSSTTQANYLFGAFPTYVDAAHITSPWTFVKYVDPSITSMHIELFLHDLGISNNAANLIDIYQPTGRPYRFDFSTVPGSSLLNVEAKGTSSAPGDYASLQFSVHYGTVDEPGTIYVLFLGLIIIPLIKRSRKLHSIASISPAAIP